MRPILVNQPSIYDQQGNEYTNVILEINDHCTCEDYYLMWDPTEFADIPYAKDDCTGLSVICAKCHKRLGKALSSQDCVFLNVGFPTTTGAFTPDYVTVGDIFGSAYLGVRMDNKSVCQCSDAYPVWKDWWWVCKHIMESNYFVGQEIICSRCGKVLAVCTGWGGFALGRAGMRW